MEDLQAKIFQIRRRENVQADHLAKAASAEHMIIPDKVLSFIQFLPLIDAIDMQEIGSESNWTTHLVSYLKDGTLPNNKEAARKLKVQEAICPNKGHLIQKWLLQPVPKMFKPQRSELCHERSP